VGSALFFFGAMSPYSWFAAERIAELIPAAHWRPVYAGALFKANGRRSWGSDARRDAGLADCERRAAAHGLGPIRWPEPWPTNDVMVARAMTFAEREGLLHEVALSAMRLAFLEGGELGALPVVQGAGIRVGLDPDRLAAAVADQEIKDAVRATHDHAISLGVFGVPSVVVGGEVFWGDDRLDEAAAAAAAAAAAGSGADGPVGPGPGSQAGLDGARS
jgi:2-hydroxychromene-2-carboxylate isomerase